jgi:prolipoprotein diacylglyceryltransferase
MKKALKKEVIFLAVCLAVGLVLGVIWAVLRRADVIKPPENEPDLELWVFLAVMGGGIALCIGGAVLGQLLRKNKKYEIEEKDERNIAIQGKAGIATFGINIFILAAIITFCLMSGYQPTVWVLGGLAIANVLSFIGAAVYYDKKM